MSEFIAVVILFVLLLGLFTLGYLTGSSSFDNDNKVSVLIAECESNLPRDVKCILFAKPEVTQ